MTRKSSIFALCRFFGIGALLFATTAMAQFTVNDGTPRGTCTSFTFANGVLALSPSSCLGTTTPTGPVFTFAVANPTSINENYAAGVVNRALTLSVHLERAGNASPLNVDIEVCAPGTNCTAVGGQDFQLDATFGPGSQPWKKTLSFAGSETDRTFDVYLVDDLVSDGSKILTFKLSNASTPAGISGDTSSLTIADDEVAPSTTVSFGFAAYQIAEGNPDGKAAIAINRSAANGPASVQVEVLTGSTTAVVGTHYNYNDPATPFTGSPPTYTVSFANGQGTGYIFIPTVENALADGPKTVALNLKNPSALSLASPSAATLTITDNDSGDTGDRGVGTDGLPMAQVTIDQLVIASNNFCAFGRLPGGNVGPCGASPVDPTACATGISGGITNAWQLNMVDPSGALTFVPFKNHTVHMTMAKRHAFSWKFKTPPAGQITSIVTGGFGQTTTTIGAEATTFISVSPTRCDFDYSKVNTINACYRSIGGTENSVPTRLSPPGSPPDSQYCDLQPDTIYYTNIRWENAGAGSRGVEACNPSGPYTQCGMVIDFR